MGSWARSQGVKQEPPGALRHLPFPLQPAQADLLCPDLLCSTSTVAGALLGIQV
jgi:hypothetical protein